MARTAGTKIICRLANKQTTRICVWMMSTNSTVGASPHSLLPLSGSEPKYAPSKWNRLEQMLETHNCYAYFLQDLQSRHKSRDAFPQPGSYALYRRRLVERYSDPASALAKIQVPYTCAEIAGAVFSDNPTIQPAERNVACPAGYYKGFLAVDSSKEDSDYHFWVQNDDGRWSHKPGKTSVTRLDASNNVIDDPLLSDRGRYKNACGYFCVPANGVAKTNSWR